MDHSNVDYIQQAKVHDVRMLDRYNTKKPKIGTLYITATHTIFVDPNANKETWILHMHIGSIEKLPLSTTGSPLLIKCKTFLTVTFVIPREKECHDVYQTLLKLSQPATIEALYCFHYICPEVPDKRDGWLDFNLADDYARMGVPNEQWKLCTLNASYSMCDTYPAQLYVPADADAALLVGSARFRSKGRLPVLTYLHAANGASICRCSQPLSGFSARCYEDEQLLAAIKATNPRSEFMYVVDTRPKINAMANRAAGKGYENEAFYENIKFQFFGIENIHVMRSSLNKIVDTCKQTSLTMSAFLGALESSGWLKHIRSILDTSQFIADAITNGTSVVVHCSDGWDRTAQVCSLAALLLNPHYRTLRGFQALIERDWLAFGHKFSERCDHVQGDGNKECSPVFTQFLDCVFQLQQHAASAFEFNERLLLTVHDHVQSCQYGTFVGNSERERRDLRLSERTYSLWGWLAKHDAEYVNPLYDADAVPGTLRAQLAPQSIRFWRSMYGRFDVGIHPREPLQDLLQASRNHCSSLEDHIQHLAKRLSALKSHVTGRGSTGSAGSVAGGSSGDSKGVSYVDILDNRGLEMPSASSPADADEGVAFSCRKLSDLSDEISSVAIDWKPFRATAVCLCATSLDQIVEKNHCRRCGEIFCNRCIDQSMVLPGHSSQEHVPVCRSCFRIMEASFVA